MRERFQKQRHDHFTFLTLFAFVAERHLFHLRHNHARFGRQRFDACVKRYCHILDYRE